MKASNVLALVGMPGCGKTTIGQYVCEQVACKFMDLDSELVAAAGFSEGTSPATVMHTIGHDRFRELEAFVLDRVLLVLTTRRNFSVLATGGGAPCFHDGMAKLLRLCCVVWLDVDLSRAFSQYQNRAARLTKDEWRGKWTRPMSFAQYEELAARREYAYAQADARVTTSELSGVFLQRTGQVDGLAAMVVQQARAAGWGWQGRVYT